MTVQWIAGGPDLHLRYRVEGHDRLVVPPFAGLGRADELWRTTCFELFLQAPGDTGYIEYNLSPSGRWAAYEFTDYRSGRRELSLGQEPMGELARGERLLVYDVRLTALAPPQPRWTAGLSAVLEEDGGAKSFWALAHPPGRPDFHHPACFALGIGPPAGE